MNIVTKKKMKIDELIKLSLNDSDDSPVRGYDHTELSVMIIRQCNTRVGEILMQNIASVFFRCITELKNFRNLIMKRNGR